MPALSNPKHLTAEGRFYVYRLFGENQETIYVGKGSGRRLDYQRSKYKCDGEIIARFKKERDAYAYEIIAITESRKIRRRFGWEMEIDRVGSRRYAARMLLRFDTRGYMDQSKLNVIRQIADGPRC